jgi:hypothetical protein
VHRICAMAIALGIALTGAAALAQSVPPDLQNRIPAPLPPPPQPPIINGPLGRSPPPGVAEQRRLDTHGDRTTRCVQEGRGYGLRGGKLDSYARSCANAH